MGFLELHNILSTVFTFAIRREDVKLKSSPKFGNIGPLLLSDTFGLSQKAGRSIRLRSYRSIPSHCPHPQWVKIRNNQNSFEVKSVSDFPQTKHIPKFLSTVKIEYMEYTFSTKIRNSAKKKCKSHVEREYSLKLVYHNIHMRLRSGAKKNNIGPLLLRYQIYNNSVKRWLIPLQYWIIGGIVTWGL